MERLLEKAEQISGIHYDISSFSDIVQAIHEVQTDLEISGMSADEAAEAVQKGYLTEEEAYKRMGTTAKEAATTIQGSTMAMKASWENLLVGFARDDADIGQLVSDFVGSVETNLDNVMPRVVQVLSGIADAIVEIAPYIEKKLPELWEKIMPALKAVGEPIIGKLSEGLSAASHKLEEAAPEIIAKLIFSFLKSLPKMLELGGKILLGLLKGIADMIVKIPECVGKVVSSLIDKFKELLGIHSPSTVFAELGKNLVDGLFQGISDFWHTITDFFSEKTATLISFLLGVWETVRTDASAAWERVRQVFSDAWEKIKAVWNGAGKWFGDRWTDISNAFKGAEEWFSEKFSNAWDGITEAFGGVKDFFASVWNDITGVFDNAFDWFKGIGENIIKGIQEGIGGLWSTFINFISGKTDEVKDEFEGEQGFDTHSPSKWSERVFRNVLQGGEIGLDKGLPSILSGASEVVRDIQDALSADPFNVSGGYDLSGGYSFAPRPQPAAATAGGMYGQAANPVPVEFTVVNELEAGGVKFERRQVKYRVSEDKRRGATLVKL